MIQCSECSREHYEDVTCLNVALLCRFGVQDVLGYLPRYNPVLTGILGLLVALHTYWFSLIAAIAWSKVTTGRASDTREDDE